MKKKQTKLNIPAATEELLDLYHAWLAYLLRAMDKSTLRVKVGDITEAIGRISCAVVREGDEYVITLSEPKAATPAGPALAEEDDHDPAD